MHTRHFSCAVFVDIFWKIEVVSVVDLDKVSWFVLNTLLRNCDFFPCKLGCDGFPWNHSMYSDGSFSQFRVFYLFFNLLYFYFFLGKKVGRGGGMASLVPHRRGPWIVCVRWFCFHLLEAICKKLITRHNIVGRKDMVCKPFTETSIPFYFDHVINLSANQ